MNVFEWAASVWSQGPPAGAIDVVVVCKKDGTLSCSPFHVRFNKFARRGDPRVVRMKVNSKDVNLSMKLGRAGEAFFVERTRSRLLRESVSGPPSPNNRRNSIEGGNQITLAVVEDLGKEESLGDNMNHRRKQRSMSEGDYIDELKALTSAAAATVATSTISEGCLPSTEKVDTVAEGGLEPLTALALSRARHRSYSDMTASHSHTALVTITSDPRDQLLSRPEDTLSRVSKAASAGESSSESLHHLHDASGNYLLHGPPIHPAAGAPSATTSITTSAPDWKALQQRSLGSLEWKSATTTTTGFHHSAAGTGTTTTAGIGGVGGGEHAPLSSSLPSVPSWTWTWGDLPVKEKQRLKQKQHSGGSSSRGVTGTTSKNKGRQLTGGTNNMGKGMGTWGMEYREDRRDDADDDEEEEYYDNDDYESHKNLLSVPVPSEHSSSSTTGKNSGVKLGRRMYAKATRHRLYENQHQYHSGHNDRSTNNSSIDPDLSPTTAATATTAAGHCCDLFSDDKHRVDDLSTTEYRSEDDHRDDAATMAAEGSSSMMPVSMSMSMSSMSPMSAAFSPGNASMPALRDASSVELDLSHRQEDDVDINASYHLSTDLNSSIAAGKDDSDHINIRDDDSDYAPGLYDHNDEDDDDEHPPENIAPIPLLVQEDDIEPSESAVPSGTMEKYSSGTMIDKFSNFFDPSNTSRLISLCGHVLSGDDSGAPEPVPQSPTTLLGVLQSYRVKAQDVVSPSSIILNDPLVVVVVVDDFLLPMPVAELLLDEYHLRQQRQYHCQDATIISMSSASMSNEIHLASNVPVTTPITEDLVHSAINKFITSSTTISTASATAAASGLLLPLWSGRRISTWTIDDACEERSAAADRSPHVAPLLPLGSSSHPQFIDDETDHTGTTEKLPLPVAVVPAGAEAAAVAAAGSTTTTPAAATLVTSSGSSGGEEAQGVSRSSKPAYAPQISISPPIAASNHGADIAIDALLPTENKPYPPSPREPLPAKSTLSSTTGGTTPSRAVAPSPPPARMLPFDASLSASLGVSPGLSVVMRSSPVKFNASPSPSWNFPLVDVKPSNNVLDPMKSPWVETLAFTQDSTARTPAGPVTVTTAATIGSDMRRNDCSDMWRWEHDEDTVSEDHCCRAETISHTISESIDEYGGISHSVSVHSVPTIDDSQHSTGYQLARLLPESGDSSTTFSSSVMGSSYPGGSQLAANANTNTNSATAVTTSNQTMQQADAQNNKLSDKLSGDKTVKAEVNYTDSSVTGSMTKNDATGTATAAGTKSLYLGEAVDDDDDDDAEGDTDKDHLSLEDIPLEEISPEPAGGDFYDSDTDSYLSASLDDGEPGPSAGTAVRKYRYRRVLIPTQEQLQQLELQHGENEVTFEVSGCPAVRSQLFVWPADARVVIIDIEGAITSVAENRGWGGFLSVSKNIIHKGVAKLLNGIHRNGYHVLYIAQSIRSSSGAATAASKGHLERVAAGSDVKLPPGPIFQSPESLIRAFGADRTDLFKAAALRGLKSLFATNHNPYYASFGTRQSDAVAFSRCGVPEGRNFLVSGGTGEIRGSGANKTFRRSYEEMHADLHMIFPDISDSCVKITTTAPVTATAATAAASAARIVVTPDIMTTAAVVATATRGGSASRGLIAPTSAARNTAVVTPTAAASTSTNASTSSTSSHNIIGRGDAATAAAATATVATMISVSSSPPVAIAAAVTSAPTATVAAVKRQSMINTTMSSSRPTVVHTDDTYSDVNYWRVPLPQINLPELKKKTKK